MITTWKKKVKFIFLQFIETEKILHFETFVAILIYRQGLWGRKRHQDTVF